MAVVGSLQLYAFGFDTEGALPSDLVRRLQWLCDSRGIRLLDALFVVSDKEGVVTVREGSKRTGCGLDAAGGDLAATVQRS